MKFWITTVGWSSFTVINPLWAACNLPSNKQFIPDKVILFNNGYKNEFVKGNVKKVCDWIERILNEYDISNPIIDLIDADEDDMNKFADTFRITMENLKSIEEKNEEAKIAIDMTLGRKFMSAIAMNLAKKFEVEKLYYLRLWGREFQNLPHMKIPMANQKLISIMEYI